VGARPHEPEGDQHRPRADQAMTQQPGMSLISRRTGFSVGTGLDVRALEKDKTAIEKEIMSLALPLLDLGGYVPMVDERVRSHISFENYAYYRELILRLAEGG
jgi:hypothetical protein